MTRRMIDTGMWSNENFAALPAMARLLQIGMINHADDQGRIKANPLYLAKEIFPYDRVTPTSISKWLELIAGNGTIVLYAVEGKQYAQLTKWWEYQSLQYAAPSDYPPPPTWKDRIRRTATKGFIATFNWTLTNGVIVEDTCDQRGKLLPPKPPVNAKRPTTSTPPVNSNGQSPDDSPIDSPESPPESTNKLNLIEPNLTKEEGRSRAYRTQPLPGEYLPGLPLPRQRQAKCTADHIASQRNRLGLTAAQLTELTDAVLERMNATQIAALDTDMGNDELRLAQEVALALVGLGHKTPEGIGAVFDTWYTHDWRGKKGEPPTYQSIIGHARDLPKKLEARKAEVPKLSEEEKGFIRSNARSAKSKIQTAEKFGGPINPDWQRDIDKAKAYGL